MEIETMESNTDNTKIWAKYFEAQKKLWYEPSISVYTKSFIRILELHRSDSKGWSISIRRLSDLLGISQKTARKAIDDAINLGWVETDTRQQRKQRKLKL